MSGTVLACTGCNNGSGSSPPAKIDTCSCSSAAMTNTIWNDHGTLKCGDGQSDGGGTRPECTSDSQCSSRCSDCYQCLGGSCSCGYRGISGSCIF